MTRTAPTTITVDPTRLASGVWSHEFNETVGEGDTAAAYSADVIALHNRPRKPFTFKGDPWVTTTLWKNQAEAYRLRPVEAFEGAATTYALKTRDCEAARRDPLGFYHGMTVLCGKHHHVLVGPPVTFVPGQVTQPGLFGDL